MSLVTSDLKQFAVIWESEGTDDYGQAKVKGPVEIKCRWELGRILNVSDTASSEQIDGTLFVGREIKLGTIVWQGRDKDLPDVLSAEELFKVVDYKEIPDIKGRDLRRSCFLTKHNVELPNPAPD